MAKIIVKGKKIEKESTKLWYVGLIVDCTKCGAKFEMEKRDSVLRFKDSVPVRFKTNCPDCKNFTEFYCP